MATHEFAMGPQFGSARTAAARQAKFKELTPEFEALRAERDAKDASDRERLEKQFKRAIL